MTSKKLVITLFILFSSHLNFIYSQVNVKELKEDNKKTTFFVHNKSNVQLSPETIDYLESFERNKTGESFRVIKTYSPNATDFGPYCNVYFIFDNHVESNSRIIVYDIGKVGKIKSLKKISDSIYEIEVASS